MFPLSVPPDKSFQLLILKEHFHFKICPEGERKKIWKTQIITEIKGRRSEQTR